MTHSSSSSIVPFGAAKLCQDFATLVNNRQGSDIQFKVGSGLGNSTLQENGETIYDESSTVTLYAHSPILRCRSRYFATMLDEDKNWKENSNGVIYKPNISPSTFQDVLHYIYTGSVRAKNSENIIELITAADEMDLEELSTECQSKLIRTFKYIFSDGDKGDESRETSERSANSRTPIDVAIRTHIIPALNLANSHSLSLLSQKLQAIMLPRMSVIIKSPDAYTAFINGISSEALAKVISSDDLAISERSVWDLVLNWGCNQMKLSKDVVETRLNSIDDDEVDGEELLDGTLVSFSQLKILKETLAPLLPFIRFSLLKPEDYSCMTQILGYFLPPRRFFNLAPFIYNPNGTELPDKPRKNMDPGQSSKIVNDSIVWEFLRKTIFERGGITGCPSLKHLKFELLFRASEHGFGAATFHQRCDNKGPTLVLVKGTNGYLFGGVNFGYWKSDNNYSSSRLNFLFTLPDGRHRKNSVIFMLKNDSQSIQTSYCNGANRGPTFGGGYDLYIADSSNANDKSYSNMPFSYEGSGASNSTLAGARNFRVSDYEVFAIFK